MTYGGDITEYGIKNVKFIEVVAWIEIILMIINVIVLIVNIINNPSNLIWDIVYIIISVSVFSMATYVLGAINT